MLNQSQGVRIYLADRRNVVHTEDSNTSFTIPCQADDGIHFFENLNVFCEITQKPGAVVNHKCSTSGALFVLPLVGKVIICDLKNETTVDAGQLFQANISDTQELKFKNPYQSEWVSYLVWEIKSERMTDSTVIDFDIETSTGTLVRILNNTSLSKPLTVQLGIFNGRQEDTLIPKTSEHRFIFVIEGAFEVKNRLLHARDGLSLPDCLSLDFEALSNKAIILILSIG